MSFRRILLGLLAFWIGLVGLAFVTLFVICLSLYLLWHGLSMSIIVFGVLGLACIIFAQVALRSASSHRKPKLHSREPAVISEGHDSLMALSSSFSGEEKAVKQRKML